MCIIKSGFQSTLSQGERHNQSKNTTEPPAISIHALARRATHFFSSSPTASCDFNPRSRKESDVPVTSSKPGTTRFQSTLSQGERQYNCTLRGGKKSFQSTLSQGERPIIVNPPIGAERFQSTLSQGERPTSSSRLFGSSTFQSTLSQGERPTWTSVMSSNQQISIHALARRATKTNRKLQEQQAKFQSTLSQGERPSALPLHSSVFTFQSTLSQGERRTIRKEETWRNTFQSTLSQGERQAMRQCITVSVVFQSTLSQGERPNLGTDIANAFNISIHALARRATRDSTKSN